MCEEKTVDNLEKRIANGGFGFVDNIPFDDTSSDDSSDVDELANCGAKIIKSVLSGGMGLRTHAKDEDLGGDDEESKPISEAARKKIYSQIMN